MLAHLIETYLTLTPGIMAAGGLSQGAVWYHNALAATRKTTAPLIYAIVKQGPVCVGKITFEGGDKIRTRVQLKSVSGSIALSRRPFDPTPGNFFAIGVISGAFRCIAWPITVAAETLDWASRGIDYGILLPPPMITTLEFLDAGIGGGPTHAAEAMMTTLQ